MDASFKDTTKALKELGDPGGKSSSGFGNDLRLQVILDTQIFLFMNQTSCDYGSLSQHSF